MKNLVLMFVFSRRGYMYENTGTALDNLDAAAAAIPDKISSSSSSTLSLIATPAHPIYQASFIPGFEKKIES
jgi:hypothetical protein